MFRYVTNDSSLVLDSVIENNTLVDVQSFNTTGLVLQDSVWNCGPATLVNLFKLYGLDVSQDEIAGIAGTDSNGTSLYGLYLACLHYGFNVSAWYLDSIEGIRVNDLVVLLLDGEYHFTLIKAINETSVLLADSSFGILELNLDDFEALFSGHVLELNSTTERGQRLNVDAMGNITGTFFQVLIPFVPEICAAAGVIGAAVGYFAYKYSTQIRSATTRAGNWVYNNGKGIATTLIGGGVYALSQIWPKKNPITREFEKVLSGNNYKVSYSPGTGNFNIKGYGSYSYSTLVSKGISASLLGEVQSKLLYNTYLKSKPKERNKLKDYNKEEREFHNRILKEYLKGTYKSLNVPDGGNGTDILKCLYEDAINNYKYGQKLIKSGDIQKGSFYLAFSFWEVSFIPSVVYVQLTPSL